MSPEVEAYPYVSVNALEVMCYAPAMCDHSDVECLGDRVVLTEKVSEGLREVLGSGDYLSAIESRC